MLKVSVRSHICRLLSACFFTLLNFSFVIASSQCRDLFSDEFGSQVITMNSIPEASVPERFVDDWSMDRLVEMWEKPFLYLDFSEQGYEVVGPVIIHRMKSLSPYDQNILKSIYERSIRPSWVRLSATDQAESFFERMLERKGIPMELLEKMYPRESDEFQLVLEQYFRETMETGFELGKISLELEGGGRMESDFITNHLVESIFDIGIHLEDLIYKVGKKKIKSLKFYHSHPALIISGAVPSKADALAIETLREILESQNSSKNVAYHIYSITRVERQFSVGHYSIQ